MLAKPSGGGPQTQSNFSNQVKAGISGIGGSGAPSTTSSSQMQYGGGGAFGPNKSNMQYSNAPSVQQ